VTVGATAWKRGRSQSNPRSTSAEARILAAYAQGIRGTRALARASQKTSVNTVQKLRKAGKIV
jgi:hypothetical protein